MNKKSLMRVLIGCAGAAIGTYVLFLISPLILNPIIEGYTPQITGEIFKASGLNAKLEGVRVVTTPKLTAGLKVKNFALYTPSNNEQIFNADNFQVKMSLIPLLARKIEIDLVQLENADIDLKINNDGSFDVMKFFPSSEENNETTELKNVESKPFALPLGLRLSNHLPDIKSGKYSITFINGSDKYVISGEETEITDFILNKSVRVKAIGNAVFKGREQFKYNVSVLNKIMPDIELNELVTNPQNEENKKDEQAQINITEILKGLYKTKLTAAADADLTISHKGIEGKALVSNLSMVDLPPSNINLEFKGEKINILSELYTAKNELSKIDGFVKTGRNPKIDLNLESKAELANILKIVKDKKIQVRPLLFWGKK